MKCKRCLKKKKEWSSTSSPIKCAFENWYFSSNNWNCWTMDILREKAEENRVHNDDRNASLIPYEYWYLYLEWYKDRGATDRLIDMDNVGEEVTLELINEIIWN